MALVGLVTLVSLVTLVGPCLAKDHTFYGICLTFPKLQRKLMIETIFSTSLPLLMTGPGAGGAAAEGSSSKGGGGGPAGSEIR